MLPLEFLKPQHLPWDVPCREQLLKALSCEMGVNRLLESVILGANESAGVGVGGGGAWKLSLMQTELEAQWEAKCEHLLSSAREQHACQFQEACEERDAQQQRVSQLEEKVRGVVKALQGLPRPP